MTEKPTELLPCPFCGADAKILHKGFSNSPVFCIECNSQALGSGTWNTRATPEPIEGLEYYIERVEHDFRVSNTCNPKDLDEVIEAARRYNEMTKRN